jgi:hypothetical protein
MTMNVVLCFLAAVVAATTAVDAAVSTKVSVLEFGSKKNVVRRALSTGGSSTAEGTTVEGVVSFVNALHDRTQVQVPGMALLPDLFRRPDASVVIGIVSSPSSVHDLPVLSNLEVGHLLIDGNRVTNVLGNVKSHTTTTIDDVASLSKVAADQAKAGGIAGILIQSGHDGKNLNAHLESMFAALSRQAVEAGTAVVVHVVVQSSEEISPHRRLSEQQQRSLEDQNAEDDKEYSGYYGYGYYNDLGEWITPYKTMFQIQYFNVVTWTAVGLAFVLIYTIFLMAGMPLEPDTLLFGESAKLIGDE